MEENKQCDKCSDHSGLEACIKMLKDDQSKQWEVIEKIRNRPPVWVSAIIALLTFLLGLAIRYGPVIGEVAKAKQ